jgi:PAS domain S-box-containing protein
VIYLIVKKSSENSPPQFPVFVSDDMVCVSPEIAEAFSRREKSLLEVLDNLPYGLFTTGQDNRIDYFNSAAERITGISATDALGRHCSEIFRSTICDGDCTLDKVDKTGKDVFIREFDLMRPDGESFPIICTVCILTGRDGSSIDKTMYVFRDILDHKRLKDDLKTSEDKYRRLFDGSKDMIFITSKEGIFRDLNQACVDLLGYEDKKDLLCLESVEKVFSNPMHWRVFKEQIDRHGFIKDYEASFAKKDGTPVYCLMSGNAVEDANGGIAGYEGIAKDITARMDGLRHMQEQYRKLSLIHAVAVAMNATQNLDDILMVALKKVLSGLGLRSGGIFLIDEDKDFALRVHYGFPSSATAGTAQIRLHDRALMRFLLKGTLPLSTVRAFPPFKATLKETGGDNSLQLTCFLINRKDRASGFFALEVPPERRISEPDQRILGSLGNFLGSAIENSLLLQTVNRHREDLRSLAARLFNSQEEERRRIARELHDEAGQALTGINYILENICKNIPQDCTDVLEEIGEVKKQISRTYQDMRSMSYRLHPAVLSDLGLEPALETYLHGIRRYSGMEMDFRMIGFEERLDPEIETVLYRISQEIVTNALRHSGAERFRLSIIKGYPNIIFVAEDDGVGFDPSKPFNQGLGLLGIRERIAFIGGTFSIRSSVGRGTKIRIEIPVKENHHGE